MNQLYFNEVQIKAYQAMTELKFTGNSEIFIMAFYLGYRTASTEWYNDIKKDHQPQFKEKFDPKKWLTDLDSEYKKGTP